MFVVTLTLALTQLYQSVKTSVQMNQMNALLYLHNLVEYVFHHISKTKQYTQQNHNGI